MSVFEGDCQFKIVLFYYYTEISNGKVHDLEEFLNAKGQQYNLLGRVLIATEGINGNLSCQSEEDMDKFCGELKSFFSNGDDEPEIDLKFDYSVKKPFPDFVVKVKKEICSTGNLIPRELLDKGLGGKHLTPREFHQVLDSYWGKSSSEAKHDKELVVLDVRNRVEYKTGRFMTDEEKKQALDPQTKTFAQWVPDYASKKIEELKTKKVLMYCTGGIRCEKASAYLKSMGVEDVSQLGGGIHRYLEEFGSNGYFKGSNFVFDSRALQKPKDAIVVGKCFNCSTPEESVSSDRCCAICRAPVLVCDSCRAKLYGTYYCDDHLDLQSIYYPFLGRFSDVELEKQIEKLKEIGEKKTKGSHRRKSINKQIERIKKFMEKRKASTQNKNLAKKWQGNPRCRSCGLIGPVGLLEIMGRKFTDTTCVCDGKCAGFTKENYENPKTSLDYMNDESFYVDLISRVKRKMSSSSNGRSNEKNKRRKRNVDIDDFPCEYEIVKGRDGQLLRTVKPYVYEYETHVKDRWRDTSIYDMYVQEFAANKGPYYVEAIKQGLILVNGEKVDKDRILKHHDVIKQYIHRHEPPVKHVKPEDMIIDNTEDLVVLDKPASVPIHPCGSYRCNSLVYILSKEAGLRELHPIHRIDRLTSGLVLIPKNNHTARDLSNALIGKGLLNENVKKIYLARVHGKFPQNEKETIDKAKSLDLANHDKPHVQVSDNNKNTRNQKLDYLASMDVKQVGLYWDSEGDCLSMADENFADTKGSILLSWPLVCVSLRHSIWDVAPKDNLDGNESKKSMSRMRLLSYDPVSDTSIVQCEPITGRTHQLRVHLKLLGHPIVNDPNYGIDGNIAQQRINDDKILLEESLSNKSNSEENNNNKADKVISSSSPQEIAKQLCVACNEGLDVAFTPIQLRYDGIDLHAYRYLIKLENGRQFDYKTKLPHFMMKN